MFIWTKFMTPYQNFVLPLNFHPNFNCFIHKCSSFLFRSIHSVVTYPELSDESVNSSCVVDKQEANCVIITIRPKKEWCCIALCDRPQNLDIYGRLLIFNFFLNIFFEKKMLNE